MLKYILFPFKLISLIALLIQMTLGTYFSTYDCRTTCKQLASILGIDIQVIDEREDKTNEKIILYQHNTYIDAFIVSSYFGECRVLITGKYKGVPILSTLIERIGGIWVEKGKTLDKIIEHVNNYKGKPLTIAPAATTSTIQDPIGTFFSGAFVPMTPVLPVLLSHSKSAVWFELDGKGIPLFKWITKRLLSPRTTTILKVMDSINPNPVWTPKDFASYTELIMKEELSKL